MSSTEKLSHSFSLGVQSACMVPCRCTIIASTTLAIRATATTLAHTVGRATSEPDSATVARVSSVVAVTGVPAGLRRSRCVAVRLSTMPALAPSTATSGGSVHRSVRWHVRVVPVIQLVLRFGFVTARRTVGSSQISPTAPPMPS